MKIFVLLYVAAFLALIWYAFFIEGRFRNTGWAFTIMVSGAVLYMFGRVLILRSVPFDPTRDVGFFAGVFFVAHSAYNEGRWRKTDISLIQCTIGFLIAILAAMTLFDPNSEFPTIS